MVERRPSRRALAPPRPGTRLTPETVRTTSAGCDVLAEIAVGRVAEIGDVGGVDRDDGGIAGEGMRDAADQREVALIGAGEDQPPVGVLEHIDIVGIEQAAAPRSGRSGPPPVSGKGMAQDGFGDDAGPAARGIGERPRRDHLAMAAVDHREPPDLLAVGADAARAGADRRRPRSAASTAFSTTRRESSTTQSEYSKASAERTLQRIADRMMGDVDGLGSAAGGSADPGGRRATAPSAAARAGAPRHGRGSQTASGAPHAARS